jgi:hypothetical protein
MTVVAMFGLALVAIVGLLMDIAHNLYRRRWLRAVELLAISDEARDEALTVRNHLTAEAARLAALNSDLAGRNAALRMARGRKGGKGVAHPPGR